MRTTSADLKRGPPVIYTGRGDGRLPEVPRGRRVGPRRRAHRHPSRKRPPDRKPVPEGQRFEAPRMESAEALTRRSAAESRRQRRCAPNPLTRPRARTAEPKGTRSVGPGRRPEPRRTDRRESAENRVKRCPRRDLRVSRSTSAMRSASQPAATVNAAASSRSPRSTAPVTRPAQSSAMPFNTSNRVPGAQPLQRFGEGRPTSSVPPAAARRDHRRSTAAGSNNDDHRGGRTALDRSSALRRTDGLKTSETSSSIGGEGWTAAGPAGRMPRIRAPTDGRARGTRGSPAHRSAAAEAAGRRPIDRSAERVPAARPSNRGDIEAHRTERRVDPEHRKSDPRSEAGPRRPTRRWSAVRRPIDGADRSPKRLQHPNFDRRSTSGTRRP